MQKKRFSDHVKQFSGIDCIFIGDQTDESPPLVILQEDMQTILIAEIKAKDEIGLPRGDLKLSTQVKALYPTPFRKGLAVLYICQNKIRFSSNRIEDNSFDDFTILDGTRQYFRLSYDEVVFNVTWQAPASSNEDHIQGALMTNKRICIVDSYLKPIKVIPINSDFSYNFIFSSYWLGHTLLYTTQNHIHYCNSEGESQIIFTFSSSRSVICNALADRISVATYDNQDDVIITTRKVHMLEPIIMGHLSQAKKESEIDLKLIKCTLKYLDTEQISKKLIAKLMQKKLYFSAWYLLQNPQSPQFSIAEKHRCLEKLHKKQELFDMIFGNNKDIMNSKQDLADAINKFANGQGSALENQILKILHSEFSTDLKYEFALKCAEISGDYSLALETLTLLEGMESSNGKNLERFLEKIGKNFDSKAMKLRDIIGFGKNLEVASGTERGQLTFMEGTRSPWDMEFSIEGDFDIEGQSTFAGKPAFDSDISSLNRLDLGFDEQAFGYQVRVTKLDSEMEPMPTVMNDNIERWLGFGSLDMAGTAMEAGGEMLGEESRNDTDDYEEPLDASEAYGNIEDVKYLMVLWRFDMGGGAKILDLSENKNNGNLIIDKAVVGNEEAAKLWENGQLESGEPMTFEDEWGKESPPNWALTFSGSEHLRIRGSKSLGKIKGHFTFQVWIKLEEFNAFTLFKRQAEDFNVKLKEPNLIEISREHSIRNILSFELSEPVPLNEWVNITIIYRQQQQHEDKNKDHGLKICLNSQIVFEDSELNFKKPLLETDGLIFCEDLIGQFTELRFWNINLSQQIVQETYKRPLDCVNELRKRIHIGDDQFAGINLNKNKSRGKRATLVAPSSKGFGFKGGLKRPPRSSVKISQNELDTLNQETAENPEKIKEESDEDKDVDKSSDQSKSDQDEPSITEDQVEEVQVDHPNDKSQTSPTNQKYDRDEVDNTTPKNEKPYRKDSDEFAFDFVAKPKQVESTAPKEDAFWNDDGFGQPAKVATVKAEAFDEFEWDAQPKVTTKQDDNFGWEEDQKPKQQPEKQEGVKDKDDWDFEAPKPSKEAPNDEFEFDEGNPNDKEYNSEPEDQQHDNSDEQEARSQPEIENEQNNEDAHMNEEYNNSEEERKNDETEDLNDDTENRQDETEDTHEDQYNEEPKKHDSDYDQSDNGQQEQEEIASAEEQQDERTLDQENLPQEDYEAEPEPEAEPETELEAEPETEPELEGKDKKSDDFDSGDKPASKPKLKDDDFDFDDPPKPKVKQTDDDFNFDAPVPTSKPSADEDFDFDFSPSKSKQPKVGSDDFDFEFGGSKPKQEKPKQQDDFGFDDFDTKPKKINSGKDTAHPVEVSSFTHEPKDTSEKIEETQEISEPIPEEVKEGPSLKKNTSSRSTSSRKGSALRKCSLEIQEFTEETSAFMDE